MAPVNMRLTVRLSSARVLHTPRRASVAAVLRLGSDESLRGAELLLIQRVAREGDRWSGQVALPGGRRDAGESDLQAAVRECREEVGLDLTGPGFTLWGRLDDRLATRTMSVATFVFAVSRAEPLALTLDKREVACAWWVPLDVLAASGVRAVPISAEPYLPAALRQRPALARALGMRSLHIPAVPLELPPAAGAPETGKSVRASLCGTPVLWGLSFGVVNDLRRALGLGPLRRLHAVRPLATFSAAPFHPATLWLWLARLTVLAAERLLRSRALARALLGDALAPVAERAKSS